MILLTLRFFSPFPQAISTDVVNAYEDFCQVENIKVLTVQAKGDDYFRVGTVMTFENDTESAEFCGFGFDLKSACEASAAHALGEYVRLGK